MTVQIVNHNPIGACPFCGGVDGEVVQTPPDVFVVQCGECFSQGPGRETAALAAEAWTGGTVRPYMEALAA